MAHNPSAVSVRPVTSKSRGICRYYTTERGCFSGTRCKFLHSVEPEAGMGENEQPLLTPYDRAKRCKYFDQGFCKRGDNCWFLHKPDKNRPVQEEDDECCSICLEKPVLYGLLGGCSHIFCLPCLKKWRDPQNKTDGVTESGNTKKCPMCRLSSKFITPSSKFWRHGTVEKQAATKAYMESMAKVPCRYFQRSLLKSKSNPICPYGKDCFYGHIKEDGTHYLFKDGVDVCMKRYQKKSRRGVSLDFTPIEELLQTFSYSMNAFNATSDHPASDTHGDTPSIHRQHNSDRGNAEEGLSPAQRLRIQDAMMRSLSNNNSAGLLAMELLRVGWEITGAGIANRPEGEQDPTRTEEQGSDGEDERENQVMERLELMADEVLASVNSLRDGIPNIRPHRPSANASSRVAQGLSRGVAERPNDDVESEMPGLISLSSDEEDESDSDMPALTSLSSDSEEDDSDDSDSDEDSELATEDPNSSEQGQNGAASNSTPSGRTINILFVDDEGTEDMPELEPIDSTETRNAQQDTDVAQPATSTNGSDKSSGDSQPSDAFTTDGRGRVINVGDSTSAGSSQPESPAVGPSATDHVERLGFFGWIGSLI